MDYTYDEIGRLITETRTFDTNDPNAPQSSNGFSYSYTFEPGGILKSVTYPDGSQANYKRHKTGVLSDLDANVAGAAKTLISEAKYRAWLSPKKIVFGSGAAIERTFDSQQRAVSETLSGIVGVSGGKAIENQYDYYADGRVKSIKDLSPNNSNPYRYYDRLFEYDVLGRMTLEKTGRDALGTAQTWDFIKYRRALEHDGLGYLKKRDNQQPISL